MTFDPELTRHALKFFYSNGADLHDGKPCMFCGEARKVQAEIKANDDAAFNAVMTTIKDRQ